MLRGRGTRVPRITLLLGCLRLAACKWRTQPSSFSAPDTFQNVCVGRDGESGPPRIYFASPAGTESAGRSFVPGTPPPQSISLGSSNPNKRVKRQGGGKFRVQFRAEDVPEVEAVVVMTADDSPHTMASKVYLSGNATEPIDVHYVGGVPQWLRPPKSIPWACMQPPEPSPHPLRQARPS